MVEPSRVFGKNSHLARFSRIQYVVGDIRYFFHSSSHQSQVLVKNSSSFYRRNQGRTHRSSELKLKIEVKRDQIGPNIECVSVWTTFVLSTIPMYNRIITTIAIWMHICSILRNKMIFFFIYASKRWFHDFLSLGGSFFPCELSSTKANIIFIFKHWSRREQTTNFASYEYFEAKLIACTYTHPHPHVISELKEKCDKGLSW